MRYNFSPPQIAGTIAAVSLATTASADFLGFDGDFSFIGDYTVIQMHAVFSNDSDIALNVFDLDVQVNNNIGFHHSDVQVGAGGTWSPTASLDIPGFADSAIDSYVNIGYGVGLDAALNGTTLDPTFSDATGGLGPYIPSGAGWYNGNPSNNITGEYYGGGWGGVSGYAVHLGQFVVETESFICDSGGIVFIFEGQIGYAQGGSNVRFGEAAFILFCPTPGALALLGLGGLTTRRRRL